MARAKATTPMALKLDPHAHPASLVVPVKMPHARPTLKTVMNLALHHHPASVRAAINRHTKH